MSADNLNRTMGGWGWGRECTNEWKYFVLAEQTMKRKVCVSDGIMKQNIMIKVYEKTNVFIIASLNTGHLQRF